jgi:hypothetical protein
MESELTPDEFNGYVTYDGALYILGIAKEEFRKLVKIGLPVGSDEGLSLHREQDSSIFWGTEGKFSYFKVGSIVNYYCQNIPQDEKSAVVRRAKLALKIDSGFVVKPIGEGKERTLRFYRVVDDGSEDEATPSETEGGSGVLKEAPAAEEAGPTNRKPSPREMKEMRARDPKRWTVAALGKEYFPHRTTPGSRKSAVYDYLRRADREQSRSAHTREQSKGD